MFIQISITHLANQKFGYIENDEVSVEYVNFDHVIKFYRRDDCDFTSIFFSDGKLVGVSESVQEIASKLGC
ncbi:hypothetical protein PANNVG_01629 [Pantoea sp. Nvir]|uniref:hypothetical protein n=1 Tax=Pantoea sp. Nvir TaxID=2576760 RepID=UPI0030CEFC22